MTGGTELEQLLIVSQAQYDHQRQAFAKMLAEETRLRTEVARLVALGQEMHTDTTGLGEMRAIGADLLWQGWLGRTKATLNLQLAKVLAMKEFEQNKVRRALGKVTALQELAIEARTASRKRSQNTNLGEAIEFSLR